MSLSKSLDSTNILRGPLPYRAIASILEDDPHLRTGSVDVWAPLNRTVSKRPGIMTNGTSYPAGHRAIWGVVSANGTIAVTSLNTTSGKYTIHYLKTGGAWTEIPSLRSVRVSDYPHEMVWINNLLYIKAFPIAAGEKLGSIVFNETDESVYTWGALRNATAPVITASGGWSSSGSDTVSVQIGLKYAYTYETPEGHETSRSPLSASTGVFSSLYPTIQVQGDADTTHKPFINIYRTSDGGNALFFAQRITNTGAGAISFEDQNFSPGGNNVSDLDTTRRAPGETDNDPPPTVQSGVIGTDDIERSSPIEEFNGRLWFAVGRNLYYSVLDERVRYSGLYEHSFRGGGTFTANRISFRNAVKELKATDQGLLVFTAKDVFLVVGELRAEIRASLLYQSIGVHDRHCATAVGNIVYWLDQKYQVRLAAGNTGVPPTISADLNDEHKDTDNRYVLETIVIGPYLWVVVNSIDQNTPANSKVFTYDVSQGFWYAPWNIQNSCIIGESELVIFGASVGTFDLTAGQDFGTNFGFTIVLPVFKNPAGNMVNLLRTEALETVVDYVKIYWIGSEAVVTIRIDSTSTAQSTNKFDPPKIESPTGYSAGHYQLKEIGDRFSVVLTGAAGSSTYSLLLVAPAFEPLMGD